MAIPSAEEIRWLAWSVGVCGVHARLLDDGSVELRFAGEIARARTIEQADAYLRFWQATQAMRAAGCVDLPRPAHDAKAESTFRLELTDPPAHMKQLRLFDLRLHSNVR
jgi:hypothetical protein